MLLAPLPRERGLRARRWSINVTDVNDKIYDAAARAGAPSDEFAAEMTAAYVEDTDRLGLGRPDAEPLATETIAGIVALIEALIDDGHAYESGGDVYFRVRSFDGYGKLSNRDPDDMDQGEEAGCATLKEDPLDFALWKARKEGEDTGWDSPWGQGRPGWHIECSAMAEELLGADFAIHGGGSDLVFPHHENEIAQTEAARGAPLAPDLDAQRHDPDRRREDVEVGRQHLPALRGARPLRARGGRRLPDLGPLPAAARLLRAGAGGGAAPSSSGSGTSRASAGPSDGEDGAVARRAPRGVPRGARRRLQHPAGARRALRADRRGQPAAAARCPAALREMLPLLGLESLLEAEEAADAEARSCWPSASRPAPSAISPAPTRSATSLPRSAGRSATGPTGARSCARLSGERGARSSTAASPVAEAERGRRRVRRVWRAETPTRELTRLAARPTTRGSSPRSIPIPYADPGTLLEAEDALVVALDQVQDPRNLGAVCRSAEAAGRRRRGDPRAARGRR